MHLARLGGDAAGQRLEAVGHVVDGVDDGQQIVIEDGERVIVVCASGEVAAADFVCGCRNLRDEVGRPVALGDDLGLVDDDFDDADQFVAVV